LLVDSGATYTLLAPEYWKAIGLTSNRSMKFTLADGTEIQRKVSECFISLSQGEGHTPVILGEQGDQSLLGSVTLEILGLILNPSNRTLHPMRMMLARAENNENPPGIERSEFLKAYSKV
jgi:predicted aspartyl protease